MEKTAPSHYPTSAPHHDNDEDVVAELFGAVAPGAQIILILEERGITPREAAAQASIDYETFFGIMSGVEPVTEALAKKLPAAVGINEKFWLRVERAYQTQLAKEGLRRPSYDPTAAARVADQLLGPAEDGLTEMELPVFSTLDD